MTAVDMPDEPRLQDDPLPREPGLGHRMGQRVNNIADGWDRFWFTPRPAVVLTVLRTSLGFVSLAWALSWMFDLQTWLGENAILPRAGYRDERLGLFQWDTFYNDTWLFVVYVGLMLSAIAVMAGRYVRVAAPVLWYTIMSMQFEASTTLNAADLLLRIWALYFAAFALLTPSRHLRVPLLGYSDGNGGRYWPEAPSWVIRLWQLQLTVIYPATIIRKLPGETWSDGTASQLALGLTDFERFPVPDFIRSDNLFVGNVMTFTTVALELALPFLLWTKRTRIAGIVLGLGMHAGFSYSMRLGFFLWVMTVGYLSFFRDDELARPLRRVAARIDARREAKRAAATPDDAGTAEASEDGGATDLDTMAVPGAGASVFAPAAEGLPDPDPDPEPPPVL